MRRVLVIAASSALVLGAILATPALAVSSHTWKIQAGSSGITGGAFDGRAGNAFYPASISVHRGDKVEFAPDGPHTITFNRPPVPVFALFAPNGATTLSSGTDFINSGFIVGAPFTLSIGAALAPGNYPFICALHLGMHGTLHVLPDAAPAPKTDADYAAIASREIARDLATAKRVAAAATENFQDEDGTPTVLVGAGTSRVTNLRFFPATVTIHKGQSISFDKTHDPTEPHTVTFGPEPAGEIAPLLPAGGPPFVYDGAPSTLVNTGFLSTPAQYAFYHLAGVFPPQTDRETIKFTKAGIYPYICALHDGAGMVGTVIVLP